MKKTILFFIMLFTVNLANIITFDCASYEKKDVVSFKCSKMEEADKETFEILSLEYAKDKNNIYYQGKVIKELDSKTFEVVKRNIPTKGDPRGDCVNYIKIFNDKNGIYQLEDIQKGVLELID